MIDVQGNIQSLRGLTANGLVLNDTGYLNLIRTGQISNSTILAQPIGHMQTPPAQRSNDVLLISTNNRDFGKRGGVNTLVSSLYQIGPLSLTNDSPNPDDLPMRRGVCYCRIRLCTIGFRSAWMLRAVLIVAERARKQDGSRSLDRLHTARTARFRGRS